MRSWKLSVGDPVSKEYYALSQSRNWELAALDVKDDWKVTSAMYLEKRGGEVPMKLKREKEAEKSWLRKRRLVYPPKKNFNKIICKQPLV